MKDRRQDATADARKRQNETRADTKRQQSTAFDTTGDFLHLSEISYTVGTIFPEISYTVAGDFLHHKTRKILILRHFSRT